MSRRLRIGLLMYGVDRSWSGITRVATELGRALLRRDDVDVVFLTPYRDGAFRGNGYAAQYLPGCNLLPGLMAAGGPVLAVAARRQRLDVIHDPTGVAPFPFGHWAGPARRVVTVHDAIAFRYPDTTSWLNGFLQQRYVRLTLRNVDGVITVSHNARDDLVRFLGLLPDRLHVVPNGVDDLFRPVPHAIAVGVAERYGLRPPYVVHVGVPSARKNVATLLSAFARVQIRRPELRLALVGSHPERADLAETSDRHALAGKVVHVGRVPDADLPAIYSAAAMLVMPSLYEGFGLPLLEAMACATPVVSSNSTSLPEVAGDAALLVDPLDEMAMAQAMLRLLSERELADALRERGLRRVREFTWDRVADETMAVYRRVLAGPPGSSVARPLVGSARYDG